MTLVERVTLWRCQACGKWSHAKRRPKYHERGSLRMPLSWEAISREEQIADDEFIYFVRCGPFEEWTAIRGGSVVDETREAG